jgi:mannose-6-phosphate isomerase-like protein (cupin superfamily)
MSHDRRGELAVGTNDVAFRIAVVAFGLGRLAFSALLHRAGFRARGHPSRAGVGSEATEQGGTAMGIRRVVTGHDDAGNAVFASDEHVEPVTLDLVPGAEFFRMWGADEAPRFPGDASPPDAVQYFPPVGGFRFGLFSVAPDSAVFTEDLDIEAALTQMEVELPGLAGHMEPGNPGMHTSATVDYEFVVSGRVVLELDDGVTKELSAGDTIVQNGTRHAWRNPYDEPCLMVGVIVGAHHDGMG